MWWPKPRRGCGQKRFGDDELLSEAGTLTDTLSFRLHHQGDSFGILGSIDRGVCGNLALHRASQARREGSGSGGTTR